MRRTPGPRLVLLVLLAASAPAAVGAAPDVPCRGGPAPSTGCPDLSPDARYMTWTVGVETFPRVPGDCAVEEGLVAPGERRLLRFPTVTQNLGPGDLFIGDPTDHPEWFVWEECHGHHHFDGFAHYRLWTPEGYAQWAAVRAAKPGQPASEALAENPHLAGEMRAGHKQGFCLLDVQTRYPFASGPWTYRNCTHQGITRGWEDVYPSDLDGQWIDVTGLPAGTYVLEMEVNAERRIEENGYADNAAVTRVTLPAS